MPSSEVRGHQGFLGTVRSHRWPRIRHLDGFDGRSAIVAPEEWVRCSQPAK